MGSRNSALYEQVEKIINALPQRAVISDSVAAYWIKETIALEGERAIWHAHRAATIGGSEAGEFPLAALGERPAYNSIESIWRQKMLLELPERPNIYMRRGTAMEPLAHLVYLKKTGHKSIVDTPEIQHAFSRPHANHPHIGGNPDEVANAGKLRIITDFKVRNSLDEDKGISLINGSQLHWYGLLHKANLGVAADGYALAELDIPAEMIDDLMRNPPKSDEEWAAIAENIAKVDRPGFGMKVRYFQHNDMLANNLIRLTKQFWEKYVLTGTPYQKPKPELPAEMTDKDKEIVSNAQNEILTFKIAESVAQDRVLDARNRIDTVRAKYDLKEWPFEAAPGLTAGFTDKFNTARAANKLLAAGVEREQLTTPSDTLNPEAMLRTLEANGLLSDAHYKTSWDSRAIKAQLKEQGLSENEFKDQTLRIAVTRKKADQPVKALLEKQMQSHIEAFQVGDSAPSVNESASSVTGIDFDDGEDEQPGLQLA